MAENKFLFARLCNSNYQTWKLRMEMLLKREDLWSVIVDTKPETVTAAAWSRSDQKCHATVVLYIEDSQLSLIKDAKSAKEVWQNLKTYHEKATVTSRVSLLKRICSLNLSESGDAEKHVAELEELFDRIVCAGQALEDPLKVAMMLRSLPDSYSGLVTALESRPEADLTVSFVKQKVLDEYQRRSERSAHSGEKVMKMQSKGQKKKLCYYCHKPGHFRKDCKLLQQHQQQQQQHSKKSEEEVPKSGKQDKKKKSDAKQVAVSDPDLCFTAASVRHRSCWYIDSGCSSHMSNDRSFFVKLDAGVRTEVVLADGSTTKSDGIGEGYVNCVNSDGQVKKILFKDVLYIPKLDSALLSVRRLTQKGCRVNFSGSNCDILSASGEKVALGELYGNLFVLKTVEYVKLSKEIRHLPNCQHTWHRRFGHRDPAAVERLQSEELGVGFQLKDCGLRQVCEHCLAGKFSRIPFPKASEHRASSILELVHTDVCGPMSTVTPGGARYLMTLIDDHSRYTVLCLLRHKSDAAVCIKRFVAQAKTQFGKTPCVIRSDGGGEYVNAELKSFYDQEGIKSQLTAAYSPQQNGVAERKNRSLQEMATCMLADAGLDKRFWGEAVSTATYLQNRLPSRSVDKTPYEKWFGSKPTLSHLRVFGSTAYVHIPDVKRGKLDNKAERLVFVGYCEDRKAYRFLNPAKNTIVISRDARFIELGNGSLMDASDDDPVVESFGDDTWFESPEDGDTAQEEDSSSASSDSEEPSEPTDDSDDEYNSFEEASAEEENVEQEEATGRDGARQQRSTRGVLPARLRDYVVDIAKVVDQEPTSYEEAVLGPEQDLWKVAMREEYDSLMKNNTWSLVELPNGRKPIGCKWVFKRKEDVAGKVSKFKARLVAQGFSQQLGVDYDTVFAPVATQTTFRILLTVAGCKRMTVRHLDVKSAYLHGQLQEELYMQQPKGFTVRGKEHLVCRLQRSLYGLKQGAKVWNDTICAIFGELGFQQGRADPCLFSKKSENGEIVYILIYVDDMVVASVSEAEVDQVEKLLKIRISLSSLGEVSHFLGIRVTKDKDGFFALDQQSYVTKVASRFKLEKAKGSKIPLDVGYYRSREGSKLLPDNGEYRSLVGALLYVAVNTRPDVAAAVSILSRKISQPLETDWVELKRIVRYLLWTSDYKLKLSVNRQLPMALIGYSDADWSGDPTDRKSVTGYVFQLNNATICWTSRKQAAISLSSMEAEYIALSEACKELVWLRRLLAEMGVHQEGPTTVHEDNTSCIEFVGVDRQSRRSKHIDTRMFYARDLCEKGVVSVKYCPSESMMADVLTKPLGAVKQRRFAEMLGLVSSGQ